MNHSSKNAGFTGIEILIALLIIGAITGGMYTVFKDEINQTLSPKTPPATETTLVNNPFPTKPQEEPEPPKESSTLPGDDGGPITQPPKASASGSWHGTFDTQSPELCAGEDGGWEANLVETNGKISGAYKSDLGGGGSVSGSSTGNQTTWNIGGSGGVGYKGTISGNTVSGNFTGGVCDEEKAPQQTKGTFFGGR